MSPPFTLTPDQEAAEKYLDGYYAGDITIDNPPHGAQRIAPAGSVRMTVAYEGTTVARWIVAPDGSVPSSWDPDHALVAYRRRRETR